LLDIAKGQIALEDERAKQAGHLLVCDTGLEVLKVWSEFKYGSCHPWILEQLHRRRYDLHLLCEPDLPWTFDPLRENPAARRELHEIYRRELLALGANFTGLKGFGEERFQLAVTAVDELLSRQLLPHE
jgi:nicotinamide riboside kinase